MAEHANVVSLEQLEEFYLALERYRGGMHKELEALGLEIRRLTHWIVSDARNYWMDELTAARRHQVECRAALTRCQSYVREEERRPCTEEKKRFEKAKKRTALCEEKLRVAAAAAGFWQREQTKNHAKLSRCEDMVESELQVAANQLRVHIETLRQYASLRSPASLPESQTGSQTDTTAAGTETTQAESAGDPDESSTA